MATRAEWVKRVGRWRASKLSGSLFAANEGVREGTLRHWAWRLGQDEQRAVEPAFVEVVVPHQTSGSGVEIVLRSGMRVRVEREFDEATLSRVIAIVEGR
jgi:hypothetical protein